jgi:choline kinase
MKMIILAAGEGTRLKPLTDGCPKCMVKYKGKPIIDYIILAARTCNIEDIVVVAGYKNKILENYLSKRKIKFYTNEKYATTNMVYSLFCAEEEFSDDIVISYADIIYKNNILEALINEKDPISVVVDKKWRELWSLRMENPLNDAETLKLDKNRYLLEIGKKPGSYRDIEGQYIGLIKIKKRVLGQIKDFYHSLDKTKIYDGKDFNNMFMTSFIQLIIDNLRRAKPVFINGGWIEIDTTHDLEVYESQINYV